MSQLGALPAKPVDVGGGHGAVAVTADVANAQVVGQKDDNVGSLIVIIVISAGVFATKRITSGSE